MENQSMMEDRDIIQLYWDRNQEAITQTKTKYEPYCSSIAHHILNNREDAEECVNDTYLRAWNSMPEQWPEFLRAFLGAITRNIALDCYRKRMSKKRGNGEIEYIFDELRDSLTVEGPEFMVERSRVREALNAFLEQLDQESRIIFVRRYWYMDSIREIKERLNVSESLIKSNLFRTRKKMALFLKKEGIEI